MQDHDMINKSASEIMTLGGDKRITIQDSNGLNSYGSKPYPKYTISYSSCTSNNISTQAYSFIEAYLHKLRRDNQENLSKEYFRSEFDKIRKNLKLFYELDSGTNIVLGASGTDIELILLFMANSIQNEGIHNVILDSNEVGSGIEHVAAGKYFSSITPSGNIVSIGNKIEGLKIDHITTSNICLRDNYGDIKTDGEIVEEIEAEIKHSLANNLRPIVHIVHRSKTGIICPSINASRHLMQRYPDEVEWVVDACQGRISIRSINEYLAFGASVLLTGSKFFSGPPFSGALLIPERTLEKHFNNIELPVALGEFFSEIEFSTDWKPITNELPDNINLGLLLRWMAAIYEMNRIFLIPNKRIGEVIKLISSSITLAIEESEILYIHDSEKIDVAVDTISEYSPFEINTIVSFAVSDAKMNGFSYDDAKFVYEALYMDLTNIIEGNKRILEIPVLIGQPVRISKSTAGEWNACLRLAISSNMVSEISQLDNEIIKMRVESDMNIIIQKIQIILENFEVLKSKINKLVHAE